MSAEQPNQSDQTATPATSMPAPPSSIHIPTTRSALSARRLSESRPTRGHIGLSTTPSASMSAAMATSPAYQHWPGPVSPNLSEAGGRAPSVSSALVDMEQEQEAQVNRLLGVIHWLQSYIADLQRRLTAETGDSFANLSVALEDVLPRVGRHPSATPRPVSISRQSSVSSYRGGGPGQSASIGISHSPSMPPQAVQTMPSMDSLPPSQLGTSVGNGSGPDQPSLRRENDMLRARIRELERQLRSFQSAASHRDSAPGAQLASSRNPQRSDDPAEMVIPSIETGSESRPGPVDR